jgi:hypothetical protein
LPLGGVCDVGGFGSRQAEVHFRVATHQVGHKQVCIACELSGDDLKRRGVSNLIALVWHHSMARRAANLSQCG